MILIEVGNEGIKSDGIKSDSSSGNHIRRPRKIYLPKFYLVFNCTIPTSSAVYILYFRIFRHIYNILLGELLYFNPGDKCAFKHPNFGNGPMNKFPLLLGRKWEF